MRIYLSAISVFAVSALQSTRAQESVYAIASTTEDFSTLATAVEKAGLSEALSGEGTFTVFAPPNSAFAKLPEDLVTKLLDPVWQPQLQDLLFYHSLGQEVGSDVLSDGMTAETLNGEEIILNLNPPRVNEDSAILIDAGLVDIKASNGVIHGIDTVLTPTSVTSNIVEIGMAHDDFSTLVEAVKVAGLVDTLTGEGPFTLLAPTNDAFAALDDGVIDSLLLPENVDMLKKILTYHVVAGNVPSTAVPVGDVETASGDSIKVDVSDEGVKINDADVIDADVIANNGIIHVIDKVLLPPSDEPAATPDMPTKIPVEEPSAGGVMTDGTIVGALVVSVGAALVV